MVDVTVIGAAIVDVLAGPVDVSIFQTGSKAVDQMKMSFGGDALNEAVVLSRLGKSVQLISKVGDDEAGRRVLHYARENDISGEAIRVEPGLATSINIVLIDGQGERYFLTNPRGSLRRLAYEDVEEMLDTAADIVSFASMFVSPLFTIGKMEALFSKIKMSGRRVFADMTKPKQGETLQQLSSLLPYVDVIVPNESEIALLTGEKDPYKNVRLLLDAGVGTVVIKCGPQGCVIGDQDGISQVRAVSNISCLDSTGAGDSFAAGFLAGMVEGRGNRECAALGCAAASCAVEQMGAVSGVVSAEEVRRRWRQLLED